MPKILITGGTGFAGSHLIESLLAAGYQDIVATTLSELDPSALFLPSHKYKRVDLSNKEETSKIIADVQPDWVFHLAAFAYVGKSFEKARELFANNINLQLNVLDAIKDHAPQARVLTIGSAEEYGMTDGNQRIDESTPLHPVNPYAVSKVTQDLLAGSYALSYKLNIIRARPFNHIGIRQSPDFVVPAFAKQVVAIERGEQTELLVGSLNTVRDFTSVKDVVRAYILLMEKGEVGQVYNIGSGKGWRIQEIVDTLISFSTVPIAIKHDPSRIRPLDVPGLIADNRKMKSLGWEVHVAIEEELKNVLEEWRKIYTSN